MLITFNVMIDWDSFGSTDHIAHLEYLDINNGFYNYTKMHQISHESKE
jgi:hypothetical protein